VRPPIRIISRRVMAAPPLPSITVSPELFTESFLPPSLGNFHERTCWLDLRTVI
jgi:hypothetical protein